METLAIVLFICGWLAAIFIVGCIMEAAVVKLEKFRKKHRSFRNGSLQKRNIQRST